MKFACENLKAKKSAWPKNHADPKKRESNSDEFFHAVDADGRYNNG